MSKNTKIFLGFLAFLLIIFLSFRNTKTGVEESLIKNKIAKATREPILGKAPVNESMGKVTDGKIPFINNEELKHKYDENKTKSSDSLVVKFEEIDEPNPEDIKNLSETYYEFIEKNSDARYFKADFTELFKKKVGDKISLVIDGEEFNGIVIRITKDSSANEPFYAITIQPNKEEYYNNIDIYGYFNLITGDFEFTGDIGYGGVNGGLDYEFKINENIGVIVPSMDFQNSLNVTYE